MKTQTVGEARNEFLQRHRLGTDTYSNPKFAVKLWGHTFWTPNPGLLPLHDLHHVATGFPATLIGESQISAYELRCGCGNPLIFILCVGAILIGLSRQPKLIIAAWKNARGGRSLYKMGLNYESLMAMNVEELRQVMNIPVGGLAGRSIKGELL